MAVVCHESSCPSSQAAKASSVQCFVLGIERVNSTAPMTVRRLWSNRKKFTVPVKIRTSTVCLLLRLMAVYLPGLSIVPDTAFLARDMSEVFSEAHRSKSPSVLRDSFVVNPG